jgi:hypothetical protein
VQGLNPNTLLACVPCAARCQRCKCMSAAACANLMIVPVVPVQLYSCTEHYFFT